MSTAIENLSAAAEDSQLKDETISTDFQEENVGEVSDGKTFLGELSLLGLKGKSESET